MKFLLIACFVIACTASTVYRSRNISVNDDGTILITAPNGKRVMISRQGGPTGQRNIDIDISGPNMPSKRIQVNDNTLQDLEIGEGNTPWSSINSVSEESRLKRGSSGKGKSQGDILAEILREYQGVVDEPQYEKLMSRISKCVRKGEISPQIYDLLEQLDQQQQRNDVQGDVRQIIQPVQQQEQLYGYGGQLYGQQGQQLYGYGRQLYGQQGQEQQQLYGSGRQLYGQQGQQQLYGYGRQLYGQQGPQLYGYGRQLYGQQGQEQQQLYGSGRQYYGQLAQELYGYSPRYGRSADYGYGVGYGYGSYVPQNVQGLLNTPFGRYLYGLRQGQYMSTTPRVNPLFESILPVGQRSYADDLLARPSTVLGRLGYPTVQGPLSKSVLGLYQNYPLLRQYGQQTPYYTQNQIISRIPRSYGIQQQQIEQINQVEQVIDDLDEVQRELQQQPLTVNTIRAVQDVQQVIEQLVEVQQEQQQVAQVVGQIEQQVEQLGGPIQMTGRQITGVRSLPLTLQQLIQTPRYTGQSQGIGSYLYRQPVFRGYQPLGVQGRTGDYLNTIPQVQVVY